jgi:hypothetical protein
MPITVQRKLQNLRNTRELRADILDLAAKLSAHDTWTGQVTVVDPIVSEAAIQEEWTRLLPAIAPEVGARMKLVIEHSAGRVEQVGTVEPNTLRVDRPNYLFEVLRLLLGASLEEDGPQPVAGITAHIEGTQLGLVDALGASPTPVRSALATLRDAGLIPSLRWLEIKPEAVSMAQLSRLGALPQVLRFRFERGARIKSPTDLAKRAEPLLGPTGPTRWAQFSLSGTPVAQSEAPTLDLIGTPRLDLIANVPRTEKTFDANVMRLLDDGLEPEPNPLAPAPVVLTLVRAGTRFDRDAGFGQARCAHPCDVFLSLLDMGLREQALQYAKAVKP